MFPSRLQTASDTKKENPVMNGPSIISSMLLCRVTLVAGTLLAFNAPAQVPETYTLTDITLWTSNQLAALPWFARWIPVSPPGAPPYFTPVAQNGSGQVAGDRAGDPFAPDRAAYISHGTNGIIAPWGGHRWGYWSYDGHDWHYYWGLVEYSHASDLNALGFITGHSTIETPPSANPLDYVEHAFLFEAATGRTTDLTPGGAGSARVYRINDGGVLIGNYATASNYFAFRREPDGTMNFFIHPAATVQPMVLNNAGLVAGIHTTYTVSNRIVVPWIASNTTVLTSLPLPPQGNPDTCTFTDLNNHGLLAGWAYKMATSYETTAVRWHVNSAGNWVAEDLNELLDAGDYILDRVLAVNDAGYLIVAAHLDTAGQPQRTLLLTPEVLPPPTTLILPPDNLSPTSAVLRAIINACDTTTTASFHWGPLGAFSSTNPASPGVVTGTVPTVVTCHLTNLQPHTTYQVQVRAVNSQGTTLAPEATFTTPYDYATWAAEKFGPAATNQTLAGPWANPDGDAWNNAAEFALGLEPLSVEAGLLSSRDQGGRLTLTWSYPMDRAGVRFTVDAATHLAGPWLSGPGATVFVDMTRQGNWETATVRTDFPSSQPLQFLRFRVQQTAP